ncbi:hypothetical protein HY224_00510 [Candidatus Uhrbacteria bacterium]|nr:hypothetical protein [Candidatus Uhrbacteria bacterium]
MESKTCRFSGKKFTVTEQERQCYERFGLPLPDIHPMERLRYCPAFYNAYVLQWTKDARTGKKILTNLDPKEFPVIYDNNYWMSSEFDARDYGREIDFTRPFFEQYKEMYWATPQPNLTSINNEDCDFCNYTVNSRHCYLTFHGPNNFNVHYSAMPWDSKDSIELFNSIACELSFQCVSSTNCYNVAFAFFAANCRDSRFLYDCVNCSDCYQCVNLKHKQFCIQNKQYTEKEYRARMAEIDLRSYKILAQEQAKWQEFLKDKPLRAQRNVNCENSDGVLMTNCRNCHRCDSLTDSDNCYNTFGREGADSADSACFYSQNCTWAQGAMNSNNIYHTWATDYCYNIGYCQMVFNSHDLFGCYGVKKASFCILNKQYTEAEYKKLLPQLIAHMKKTGEWGQWFPYSISPFPYADSSASGCFPPLSPEQAKRMGVRQGSIEVPLINEKANSVLPDNLKDTGDEVLNQIFPCAKTGQPYKITKDELEFHRQVGLALPRWYWQPRIEQFYSYVPRIPFEAHCGLCGKEILSIEDPAQIHRPVWCDECFNKKFGA